MKDISVALKAHYAGNVLTLATIWRITLISGTIKYFTDHDKDITYDGETYLATGGYSASDIQSTSALNVDNLEVNGFLLAPHISRDELLAGRWNHAKVEIMRVNYKDLTMLHEDLGTGRLGEVKIGRNKFTAELRLLMQPLQRNIGSLTSPVCRYDLGDSRCTKDLTDYTVLAAEVTSLIDERTFITDLPSSTVRLTPSTTGAPTDDYFQGGPLTWVSGNSEGLKREVELYDAATGTVTLAVGMYDTIQVGDTFNIVSGCNKLLKTGSAAYNGDCKIKFGNVINFGGEPELSGEKSLNIGGQ